MDGFRSRVNANVVPLVQRDPAALRNPVADGVEELGKAAQHVADNEQQINDRLKTIEYQTQTRDQLTAGMARVKEAQAAFDTKRAEAQLNATEGHAERLTAAWQSEAPALLQGVTSRDAQEALQRQIDAYGSEMQGSEGVFEIHARVKREGENAQVALNGFANRVAGFGEADKGKAKIEYAGWQDYIRTMQPIIGEDAARKLDRIGTAQMVQSQVQGAIQRGETGYARALLGNDAVKPLLDPDTMANLSQDADVADRRAAAQQEHAAALAKGQMREQLATVSARIEAGEDVPDAELVAASNAAASIGDASGAYKLQVTRVKNGVSKETQPWTPMQYSSEIGRLRALGEKATPADDIRLKQLEAIAPGRVAEFNSNPAGWAALNGHPAPTLDLHDPASIQARIGWATTVNRATGRPMSPLTPEETQQLAAQMAGSPAARVAVIDQVANIGAVDRRASVAAMRSIAPSDPVAQQMVLMNANDRHVVPNGIAARKADKTLIDDMRPDGSGDQARDKFNRDVAPALRLMGAANAGAVSDLASSLYADWAQQHGVARFNAAQYGTMLQRALGARQDAHGVMRGGVGYWNGVPVKLAPSLGQAELETVLSRMAWGDKSLKPVFRNGQVMTPTQVRALTPVQRPDGFYEFHGERGDPIPNDKGGIFTVDLDYLWRHQRAARR